MSESLIYAAVSIGPSALERQMRGKHCCPDWRRGENTFAQFGSIKEASRNLGSAISW